MTKGDLNEQNKDAYDAKIISSDQILKLNA